MVKNKDLTDFMLSQLGGEAAVHREYAKSRLMKVVSGGATIGEVIETAKKEDWLPSLLATPLASLAGGSAVKSSGGRMTVVEKEALLERIVEHLKKNPKSGKRAICEALNTEPVKTGNLLRILKTDGKIKSTGQKASMVYSVK